MHFSPAPVEAPCPRSIRVPVAVPWRCSWERLGCASDATAGGIGQASDQREQVKQGWLRPGRADLPGPVFAATRASYRELPPPGRRRRRKCIRCSSGRANRRRIRSSSCRSLSRLSAAKARRRAIAATEFLGRGGISATPTGGGRALGPAGKPRFLVGCLHGPQRFFKHRQDSQIAVPSGRLLAGNDVGE